MIKTSSIKTISDSEFKDRVATSDKTVMVGFWAKCSAPSRLIESFLSALAAEYADTAEIYRMDTNSNSELPGAFRITETPTLLIFKKGKLLNSYVGTASKTTIRQLLAVRL